MNTAIISIQMQPSFNRDNLPSPTDRIQKQLLNFGAYSIPDIGVGFS